MIINFQTFIFENEKLRHLSHAEDRIIEAGKSGFRRAFQTLHSVHKALTGRSNNVKLLTKMDGAPSVVFGHHPETGQFFVASKSAWNKKPKLNYTEQDIEQNHGHAPGLVAKLKTALQHLPKVTPKKGVFQGDFMYSKNELSHEGDKTTFTPNTITYKVPTRSAQGRRAQNAEMGFYVHTSYAGKTFADLKPNFTPNVEGFRSNRDVHLFKPEYDRTGSQYSTHRQQRVRQSLIKAAHLHKNIDYDAVAGHNETLSRYVNQTVREKRRPTVKGYYKHLTDTGAKPEHLEQVRKNFNAFKNLLSAHGYLELAKNTLVNALDTHSSFEHSIAGRKSGPEGYVAVQDNVPTKIVKRREDVHGGGFSAANFGNVRFRRP